MYTYTLVAIGDDEILGLPVSCDRDHARSTAPHELRRNTRPSAFLLRLRRGSVRGLAGGGVPVPEQRGEANRQRQAILIPDHLNP